MKRLSAAFIALTFSSSLLAEGYQVNLQSTKQTAMGHVGAALKLGAESIHFNPAGMAFMENSIDLSAGASFTYPIATFTSNGIKSETNNPVSTPFFAYAGFKIYDNLAAGIGINTPYGSTLKWGKNWVGADVIQDIALQSFNIQPTLAYKVCDKLSIGAGMMIAFGNVELSRAMLPAGTLTAMGMGPEYADVIPVSATLTGNSKISLGYNVGVLYDLTERISLGASFRSCVRMKVEEGTARLDYASDAIKSVIQALPTFPQLDQGTFAAEMPMPANLNIGVSFRTTDRLLLSAEAQAVFWKAYDKLDINFSQNVLNGYSLSARKNYKNVAAYRIGGEYNLTERFDLRAGLYYDQSPIRKELYNPETPGMDKIGISTGFSFRPVQNLSVDFALLYIQGISRDGEYAYTNGLGQPTELNGRYTNIAISPSLGLSYRY